MIGRISDCDKIYDYIAQSLNMRAYQIALLEKPYSEFAIWVYKYDDKISGLAGLYTAGSRPVTFLSGDINEIIERLSHIDGLAKNNHLFIAETGHIDIVRRLYKIKSAKNMIRMTLKKPAFRPASGSRVKKLGTGDIKDIRALMKFTPDFILDETQLKMGLFFGIRVNGTLVSMTGSHFISQKYRTAGMGNIITHADFRRRGYAISCSSRLISMLFNYVDLICLNVNEDNTPAISMYDRLGFLPAGNFYEIEGEILV